MISKQLAKFVKSLKLKKYRNKASAFVVEGAKNVSETLNSKFEIQHLFITEKYLKEYGTSIRPALQYTICSEKELINLGTFQSNEYALAVVKMNEAVGGLENDKIVLVLDSVSDPGNLGTIIRIADWYGIKNIIASEETADFYNPKVISASMGSFTRVEVQYMDLALFFKKNPSFRVYGAFLDGKNIHAIKPEFPTAILLGSESNGIHPDLHSFCYEKITIPRFGMAESLNVAVSAAVICDNLMRH
jgi:RNA methyltransferase, TrmH family